MREQGSNVATKKTTKKAVGSTKAHPPIEDDSYAGKMLKAMEESRERVREQSANRVSNRFNWGTYLHHMVQREDLAEIDDELEHGQDINTPTADRYKFSPLHLAAFLEKPVAAKHLIERGADLNGGDAGGNTPLMVAVFKNSVEICQLLLDVGADVGIKNVDGEDAMAWASKQNQPAIELAIRRALLSKIAGTEHEEPPPPKM